MAKNGDHGCRPYGVAAIMRVLGRLHFRRNGVPYSEHTVVTECFDRLKAEGDDWLTVFTIVDDPRYLSQQFITSTHFKREPDASKWMPTPCEPVARASR